MNFIDIIIIILVLIAAFKGFVNGLIKELISLISLIAGIYVASYFSVYVEQQLNYNFPKIEEYNAIISFALVFTTIYLSLKLAGIIIHKFVKIIQLNLINKISGLLFGSIKAILIISFVLLEINHLEQSFNTTIPKKQKEESKLYPLVENIIPTVIPIVKEKIKNNPESQNILNNKTNELKQELDPN